MKCKIALVLKNIMFIKRTGFHPQHYIYIFCRYKSDPVSSNPFAPVFIHLLNSSSPLSGDCGVTRLPRLNQAERQFLTQLIAGQGRDLVKKTAAAITTGDLANMTQVSQEDVTRCNLLFLQL